MTKWMPNELGKIGDADEIQIVTLRRDGSVRKPVTIWVVRVGEDIYVRSGYGNRAAWYRGARACREGHVAAAGIEKDVRFEDADAALNEQIDAAYRSKYRRHGARWVDPMVSDEAQSATIRVTPC